MMNGGSVVQVRGVTSSDAFALSVKLALFFAPFPAAFVTLYT